jgi:hypothetical protein
MSGLIPLPGSPDVVEGVAAALRDEAQRVASAHERLLLVRQGATWDSPAGRAFAAQVAQLPPVLDAVARRYAGAAAVLRVFAVAFREAQDECTAAITLRERGVLRRDRFAEALAAAESSASPDELARVPVLRELMAQGAGEVLDSERRYVAARHRFDEADQRCRRSLEALGRDVLTDSWQYNGLKGAATVGDSVAATAGYAALFPPWRPAATVVSVNAGAVGTAAHGLVKLAYDEGSWAPLIEGGVLGMVGFSAQSLRAASVARGLPTAAHEGPTGFAGPGRRLLAGIKSHGATNDPWKLPPAPARPARPATAVTGRPRPPWRERARATARRQADRKLKPFRDDWGVASHNGADARAMLQTAWGLQAGRTLYEKGTEVNDAYERVAVARERWQHRRRSG